MEPQDSVYEEKKSFRHVMVQKIPFFEKLTIFFPFFCPFFPFGGGYSAVLTLYVIELVMTFRMIGHMTNNRIYFYTKKHFEIMYYRFLQFLACIHRNGDIRLILCDNTFWLFRPNLGSWVQKLKHFFFLRWRQYGIAAADWVKL